MNTTHRRNWRKRRWMFIPFVLIALFTMSLVVMLLWNLLVADIFQLDIISYWQAMGLLVLSRILFGGFGGKGHWKGRHHGFKERFMNMTDEEKRQFKEKWKEQHGGHSL